MYAEEKVNSSASICVICGQILRGANRFRELSDSARKKMPAGK
jgi:hypothetical protein